MKIIDVNSPFDGSKVGEVKFSSKEEVSQIIDNAHKLFLDKSKHLTKTKRIEILEKAMVIISKNKDELVKLTASEGGKPWVDSVVEVTRAIDGIKIAIEHLSTDAGTQIPMGHTKSSENRMAFTFKEPIGVVVAISAFNHPFNLAIHQIIPAVAIGCPVIIKPSIQTPMSAIKIVEILEEAGLPKGWASAVVCDDKTSEYLATSPKIDFLTFIGSAKVGWYLNSKVASGTRVALEHGGVAPVIIEPTANIDELIPAIGKGAFYHAGQVCVSVQRIFVEESICDEVASKLTTYASKLIVGNQMDKNTEVGPLISSNEVERIEQWIEDAKENDGKILTGGKRISNSCFEPTVILNPNENALVSTKEVFAPVVCIYSYKTIDEAIQRANSLDVSFQASIFTKDIDIAFKCIKELNATTVMVNDHTAFRVDWMPFGGAKQSGLGMGGICHSMNDITIEKMMVFKSPSL